MMTPLSKHGGRRYGQMNATSTGTPGFTSWLRSVGAFVQLFKPEWATGSNAVVGAPAPQPVTH